MVQHGVRQTFLDPTGRRRARLRFALIFLGIATTAMVLTVLVGALFPPLLPELPLVQTAADSLGRAARTARPTHPISVRAERERIAARQRLFDQLTSVKRRVTRSRYYAEIPLPRRRLRPDSALAAHQGAFDPTVVG